MSVLRALVGDLSVNPRHGETASHVIAAWILHDYTASEARTELKEIGASSHDISTMMDKARYNYDVYIWKLNCLNNMRKRRRKCLTFGGMLITPPPIMQPLNPDRGEEVLQQALKDVEPIINSLYWRRLKFVDNLMQGTPRSQLVERAILTFRWEYPFTRNPGAVLNSAITNYSNNIVRDATASCRMTFTGKKSDGNLESIVLGVEYLEQLPDTNTSYAPDDMIFDMSKLTIFDQKIVSEILTKTFSPKGIVDELSKQFQVGEDAIRASFARVAEYVNARSPLPSFLG